MLRPIITYLILERLIPFGFGATISLNSKTCCVPHFIGASLRNFETIDLGIKPSVPLALDGKVNPIDALVLAMEGLHICGHTILESLQDALSASRG